jgi:hypothetical protein
MTVVFMIDGTPLFFNDSVYTFPPGFKRGMTLSVHDMLDLER